MRSLCSGTGDEHTAGDRAVACPFLFLLERGGGTVNVIQEFKQSATNVWDGQKKKKKESCVISVG